MPIEIDYTHRRLHLGKALLMLLDGEPRTVRDMFPDHVIDGKLQDDSIAVFDGDGLDVPRSSRRETVRWRWDALPKLVDLGILQVVQRSGANGTKGHIYAAAKDAYTEASIGDVLGLVWPLSVPGRATQRRERQPVSSSDSQPPRSDIEDVLDRNLNLIAQILEARLPVTEAAGSDNAILDSLAKNNSRVISVVDQGVANLGTRFDALAKKLDNGPKVDDGLPNKITALTAAVERLAAASTTKALDKKLDELIARFDKMAETHTRRHEMVKQSINGLKNLIESELADSLTDAAEQVIAELTQNTRLEMELPAQLKEAVYNTEDGLTVVIKAMLRSGLISEEDKAVARLVAKKAPIGVKPSVASFGDVVGPVAVIASDKGESE